MQFIVNIQTKTIEFLNFGDLEKIQKIIAIYPDYIYKFS